MPKKVLFFLKIFVSVGLAAVLLYLVFRDVAWVDFWQKAKAANYTWVIVSISLSFVAYPARAYRWNILLEPMGYKLKTSRTTLAVLIGYLANLALPRLGEITRCGVLNRSDNVPVSTGLGTVVVDRLTDLIVLFILMGATLTIESERLIEFLTSAYSDLAIPSWVPFAVIGLGILGLATLILFIRHQDKLKGKLAEIMKQFVAGFVSLKNIKRPLGFIVSTLIIWVVYYLMAYVIVFSLPETSHLDFGAGMMLLITGGIALALPVQSGFGTYHGMVAGMLLLYSVEESTGIFLATLLHSSQIVAIALFGTLALIITFISRRKANVIDKG